MEIKFSNSSIFEFICLIVVGELSRQFAGSEEQAHTIPNTESTPSSFPKISVSGSHKSLESSKTQ